MPIERYGCQNQPPHVNCAHHLRSYSMGPRCAAKLDAAIAIAPIEEEIPVDRRERHEQGEYERARRHLPQDPRTLITPPAAAPRRPAGTPRAGGR